MEYRTDDLGLKFIHWDFNSNANKGDITGIEPRMKLLPVVKPATKIKNGLLIKYHIKISREGTLVLDCIAENIFINDGIVRFTFSEAKDLIQFSFDKFNKAFEEKAKQEGLWCSVDYTIKDYEVLDLLRILQK